VTSFIQRSYRDWSGEVSGFEFTTLALDGSSYSALGTLYTAFDDAIADLTSGQLAKKSFGNRVLESSDNGVFGSRREEKILLTYKGDTSEKLFRVEIPCPNLVEANYLSGTDTLDMANGEVAALVTAFEDLARSPDNGTETVTVISLRVVGRNI